MPFLSISLRTHDGSIGFTWCHVMGTCDGHIGTVFHPVVWTAQTQRIHMLTIVNTYYIYTHILTDHAQHTLIGWGRLGLKAMGEKKRETTHVETLRITEPASKLAAPLHGTKLSLQAVLSSHLHQRLLYLFWLFQHFPTGSKIIKLLAGRSVHFQEEWVLSRSCGPLRIPPVSNLEEHPAASAMQ